MSFDGCMTSETITIIKIQHISITPEFPHTSLFYASFKNVLGKEFLKILYFWSRFRVHNKTKRKIQWFSIYPLPPPIHNLPHYQHLLFPQSGTSATIDEPTLTHHNHSKSVAYIRVHSWCYTVWGVEQMYNETCPSSLYHTKYFHCSKNLLCSAYLFIPDYSLYCLHGFNISRII